MFAEIFSLKSHHPSEYLIDVPSPEAMGNAHRNMRNIPTMGNAHRNAHRQIPHYIAQCNIAHIGYKKALFSR
jgi:hypothetical protein